MMGAMAPTGPNMGPSLLVSLMKRLLVRKRMTNPLQIVILSDRYFIDLMLEQLYTRNKSGPTYNAQAG